MMIVLSILLLLSILFLAYGIYLLAVMNKDESKNKYIPGYIKDHMKASGIVFTSVGAIGAVVCGLVLNKEHRMLSGVGVSKSNFGFKFY